VIWSIAEKHQLSAIIYYQSKNEQIKTAFASQMFFYTNRKQQINELRERLIGIDYVFVKGMEIAELYPVPGLRSMGDSDLLVRDNDYEKVHNVFIDLGYSFDKYHDEEWKYKKSSIEFEMHNHLIHVAPDDVESKQYFDNVWNHVVNNKLDWNFHVVYLIKHLSRHLINGGVGFRQFMDLAIVAKKVSLNWKWIEKQLKKISLYDFATNVFGVINKWFEVRTPLAVNVNDTFYELATQTIFLNGVFGKENDANKNPIANKMYRNGESYSRARLKYFVNKLCPNYDYMANLSYCNYVRKTKALLVIAWVHRWIIKGIDKKSRYYIKKDLDISEFESEEKV
jgi:hypothetical protein